MENRNGARESFFLSMALFFLPVLLLFSPGIAASDSLVFGAYPFGDPAIVHSALKPLTDYLSEKTAEDIRLVVTRDYKELFLRLADGTVDFAWIGSSNYVKSKKEIPGLHYLATYLELDVSSGKELSYYHSYIITLVESGIGSLEDLEGRRFGFTDPESTSGYAYPKMILEKSGIVPEQFFGSLFYLGRHDNVIGALLSGSLDAGAVSDGTYVNAVKAHGEKFRILARSEPIPLDAVAAAPHVDQLLRSRVRSALTALTPESPSMKAVQRIFGWPAAGFSVEASGFYDSVERALSGAGVP
jgi:phosphonate transport system substrate-binding protein